MAVTVVVGGCERGFGAANYPPTYKNGTESVRSCFGEHEDEAHVVYCPRFRK